MVTEIEGRKNEGGVHLGLLAEITEEEIKRLTKREREAIALAIQVAVGTVGGEEATVEAESMINMTEREDILGEENDLGQRKTFWLPLSMTSSLLEVSTTAL